MSPKCVAVYGQQAQSGVVVVVVVPQTARGDADILQSLLADERLHDDLVPRETALGMDAGFDGIGDGRAPALAVVLVELLALQPLGHALGDDVAHLFAPEAGCTGAGISYAATNRRLDRQEPTVRLRWAP
ncbi:unnamed protein product [Phytophthora lilii]|uniref:Unnamed protein product n=1 Tax=Phytophthora lilii TaxID=2077276 RepID=A0A9W6TRP5_9STRA|nr:unnamed protein product [Phytophthora lilii]